MSQTIPDDGFVIIVGAMKAGTTSLFNYLKNHPAICPSVIKEPEYFSQHQRHGMKARALSISRYSDLWQFDSRQHRYALEASTGYTKAPVEQGVAKRIYDYGVRPKLIYIVRNPFERILSHRNFVKNDQWANEQTFDLMLSISNYYYQISAYTEYFPAEDLLILDFDDLKQDPAAVMQRAFDFLDLPPIATGLGLAPSNVTRRESSLEKTVRKFMPALGRSIHAAPLPLRRAGLSVLKRLPKARREVLNAHEMDVIQETLYGDMLRLRDAFDIDVSKWGFEDAVKQVEKPGYHLVGC